MRSLETWRWAFAAASVTLNMAFIGRDVFHEPFSQGLAVGLGVFGALFLIRYTDGAERRRRNRVEQRAANAEEQDASSG
jgi:hypothetical protein